MPMTSLTNVYHVTRLFCKYGHLVILALLWGKLSKPQLHKNLTRKVTFLRSWFKFDSLGLALSMELKFYISVKGKFKTKTQKALGANYNVCRSYPRIHSYFYPRIHSGFTSYCAFVTHSWCNSTTNGRCFWNTVRSRGRYIFIVFCK